jgi:hypothetical protein
MLYIYGRNEDKPVILLSLPHQCRNILNSMFMFLLVQLLFDIWKKKNVT